ncbi:MAG: glycosyltransferase [Gemmatimonadetes bacterium]|nr:glycosyltransferase [Gemmatimonadota bacterium]
MNASSGVSGLEEALAELREDLRGAPPIVCFANDWRGDPTSKHHIMRTYAEETDVLWVESSGMRRPQLSKTTDLRRMWSRVRRAAGGLREVHPRLHVLSPLSIPLPGSDWARRANAAAYRFSIRGALRRLRLDRPPLLWVYTPTVVPYLAGLPRAGLVYHCVDRWWAFADYDAAVMRACHEALCRQASVVFASSQELLEDCLAFTPNAHLIRHGVEWAHFARAATEELPRPADIADIAGPVLGFFGLIHEWIDQHLLARLADAFPDATLVLIGKVQADTQILARKPNIRFLGQKPYAELPAYAAAFDVALIPFVMNELTAAVNPIKLREYLSAGLPVVATALPEIRLLADNPMVRIAADGDAFIAGVRAFLDARPSRAAREAAALAMASESWPGRCARMIRLAREAPSWT